MSSRFCCNFGASSLWVFLTETLVGKSTRAPDLRPQSKLKMGAAKPAAVLTCVVQAWGLFVFRSAQFPSAASLTLKGILDELLPFLVHISLPRAGSIYEHGIAPAD